ncbi:hypothetical protein BJX96DRAFT_135034 [Aspergillus floccosus]
MVSQLCPAQCPPPSSARPCINGPFRRPGILRPVTLSPYPSRMSHPVGHRAEPWPFRDSNHPSPVLQLPETAAARLTHRRSTCPQRLADGSRPLKRAPACSTREVKFRFGHFRSSQKTPRPTVSPRPIY